MYVCMIVCNLFYDLNTLTVFDQYKFQLAIFMYNHQSRKLPPIFDDYFIAKVTHDHCTCTRSQFRLHTIPYKTNTKCFTLRLAGPKVLNYGMLSILIHVVNVRLMRLKLLIKNNELVSIIDICC